VFVICPNVASPSELDAFAIEQTLRSRHLPYGTVLDPIFASPDSDNITAYTRGGDSAIWTGHYLAAESFRYSVTHSDDALDSIRRTIAALNNLVTITGKDLLARVAIPVSSPFAEQIINEERHHGIYKGQTNGTEYYWVGHTSRDQYLGVFFGLAIAYDLVNDAGVQSDIRSLVDRMMAGLLRDGWNITMPTGSISSTFLHRVDQQLALLQVARHVLPGSYSDQYRRSSRHASLMFPPLSLEALDRFGAYFKFNLDAIVFYNLIRLEDDSKLAATYRAAYRMVRTATRSHPNPFFLLIDEAIEGPDPERQADIRRLEDAWLRRPRRDFFVDLRGLYPVCGGLERSCNPVSVEERVPSDFLWQRSPFQTVGGGAGRIEGAGIDYLLPYWMGRYYGLTD
jgi:hypothetical protein